MRPLRMAAVLALMPLAAHALQFQWPAACKLGQDCFIQNYLDHQGRDFNCGPQTYANHRGTDIRLRRFKDLEKNIAVLAAADGEVISARDGVVDKSVRDATTGDDTAGKIAIKDVPCGNAVDIRHTDGYVTRYCHMRQGSIAVHPGDRVAAGTPIGILGLSGFTDFPHIHFQIFKDDVIVDPFTSQPMATPCDQTDATHPKQMLWATPVAILPAALMDEGFSNTAPRAFPTIDTPPAPPMMAAQTTNLYYWTRLTGIRQGDALVQRIFGPTGKLLYTNTTLAKRDAPYSYFRYIYASPAPGSAFTPGRYTSRMELLRKNAAGDAVLILQSTTATTLQ